MPFSTPETLLINLIHDLRQPLSNIEGTTYNLAALTAPADRRIHDHVRLIERQLEEAERLLAAAAAQLAGGPTQQGKIELTKSAS